MSRARLATAHQSPVRLALMIGYAEELPRITSEVIDSVHADLAAQI